MLSAFGPVGSFGFYAGLNIAALVMIFLFVPGLSIFFYICYMANIADVFHIAFPFLKKETKQRTLEELDYVFAVPTTKHVRYQVKEFLPYWIRRYVLMRRGVRVEPLYQFDQVRVDHDRDEK